jgi:predicted porin
MRRGRFSGIATSLALASAGAMAQSSVNIYGIVDACLAVSQTGNGSKRMVNSGCQNGTRIGFRGQEDLGGGLKAYFQLEQGPMIDDGTLGQGGRGFGRKAILGLSSPRLGTIEMGRDYSATFYLLSPIDPLALGFGTLGSTMSTGANPTTAGRNDNAINYLTPSFSGLSARVQYALGEQAAPAASRGRDTISANLIFRDQRWIAGIAANSHRSPNAADRDNTLTAGLSRDFGTFRLSAAIQAGKWEASRTAAAPFSATAFFSRDYRSAMIGGTVQVTPFVRLAGSLKRYDDRTAANLDATQATLLASYAFSKRTDVYAGYSWLDNSRTSAYSIADGTTTYSGIRPGANTSLTAAGIRHVF